MHDGGVDFRLLAAMMTRPQGPRRRLGRAARPVRAHGARRTVAILLLYVVITLIARS